MAHEAALLDTPFARLRERLDAQERGEAPPGPLAQRTDELGARIRSAAGPLGSVPFPVWAIGGLLAGFALGTWFPALEPLGAPIRTAIGTIGDIAPLIILFTLTPALVRMYATAAAGKFALYVVAAFVLTTTLGGLFALLVSLVFFPDMTLGFGAQDFGQQFGQTTIATLRAMIEEPVFRAIWGALLMSVLLYFGGAQGRPVPRHPARRMMRTVMDIYVLLGVHGLSALGRVIKIIMPPVLFLLGIWFVTSLTGELRAELGGVEGLGEPVWTPLQAYLLSVGVLVLITWSWLALVSLALTAYTRFPLRRLVGRYIAQVYPFAWATSSSAASLPLNLAASRDELGVRPEIRSFVLPVGATANLDGTMMAAVVGTIVAAKMIGYDVSVLDFLFAMVPLILITIGTPGVPGGLAVVAAPIMAAVLPLPGGEAGSEAFVAIFIALLFGPNDMFRTAVNVLDNGFLALLLDKWWPERFTPGAEVNPFLPVSDAPAVGQPRPAATDATPSGIVHTGPRPGGPGR